MATARGSRKRRIWAYIFFFISFVYATSIFDGVGDWRGALFYALGTGAVAVLLLRSARKDEERFSQVARNERQLAVLRLAAEDDGQLTVTEVAARLGWSIDDAAATLRSLDDGLRVTSTVTDEGIMLYEFRELIHDPGRRARVR